METSTNQIISKIKNNHVEDITLFAEALRKQGKSARDIKHDVGKYIKRKIDDFYSQKRDEENGMCSIIKNVFDEISTGVRSRQSNYESTAENIFYNLLKENKIPFKYQYKIGKYRVDYLIDGFLVFEGDGPHHKNQIEYDIKRDLYIKKMGYKVMRLTWNIVALSQNMVIEEIKNIINQTRGL